MTTKQSLKEEWIARLGFDEGKTTVAKWWLDKREAELKEILEEVSKEDVATFMRNLGYKESSTIDMEELQDVLSQYQHKVKDVIIKRLKE